MGFYKYIRDAWKKPSSGLGETYKNRLIEWRKEPVTVRLEHPTRLDRARSLGYRAKPGFVIVRQRLDRGGRMREKAIMGGRKPKKQRRLKVLAMNYQWVAEQRANDKYVNCEVLNSYWVGEDGKRIWHEVILVDRAHPQVLANKQLMHLVESRGRVYRGITSAGRKSRGLRHKGVGAEKIRPSLGANKGRH
ncbi:MAG: 50S ribosomal protein L15e [Nanoarchaeota archaeon]